MIKNFSFYIIFLVCTSTISAGEYIQFCGTQAAIQLKNLNSSQQDATLIQIEKLKKDYNSDLANTNVSTGVKSLNDKFLKNKDYSSALLLEMITEMVKDPSPKSKRFSELCDRAFSKVNLCKLQGPERKSVEATFLNFKAACNYTDCDKNSDVNSIKSDLIEAALKDKEKLVLTPEIIAGLKPKQQPVLVESGYRKKIREQIGELQNAKFKDVESLKKYIGEKYLRVCSDAKPSSEIISNCGAAGVPRIMNLEIADQNFKILGVLSNQLGEESIFSKDEIKNYKKICDNNRSDEKFVDACKLIDDDFKNTKNVKEAKDWKQIRKNNYVINDPSTKEGYRIVPKKTNTEIFLGVAAPAIANFSNFWMWNIQQQAQIDMMGQQAILRRQYGYGYFGAYNNGYFPATYLPPYAGVPSLSVSTGFNFGL